MSPPSYVIAFVTCASIDGTSQPVLAAVERCSSPSALSLPIKEISFLQ